MDQNVVYTVYLRFHAMAAFGKVPEAVSSNPFTLHSDPDSCAGMALGIYDGRNGKLPKAKSEVIEHVKDLLK